ncbi:hypothetical protein D3C71_1636720 [compost metagenome]
MSVRSTPRLLLIQTLPMRSGTSWNTVSTGMPCSSPTRASVPFSQRYRPRSLLIHIASPICWKPNTLRPPPSGARSMLCTRLPRSTRMPSMVPIHKAPSASWARAVINPPGIPGTLGTSTPCRSMRTTPFWVPAQTAPARSMLIARMLPPGRPSAVP